MWTRAFTVLFIACSATGARAQCRGDEPDADDDAPRLPCQEPYARWSIVPELAALAGWGPDGVPRSVLGAEVRVRYNRPWHDPSHLYTIGVGAETFHLATLEPYLTIGRDELARWCLSCSDRARLFGAAHMAIGGGAAWSAAHRGEPFVLARITFGLLYARPAGKYLDYIYPSDSARGGQLGRATRFRFSSQIELVLETVVDASGEYRFAMGISLDPFRIIQDEVALDAP